MPVGRFPAGARAITVSHMLFIPRVEFIEVVTQNPSLALNMLSVLSMRLREFAVHVENPALKEVPGRLAAYLVHLVDEQNNLKNDISLNTWRAYLLSDSFEFSLIFFRKIDIMSRTALDGFPFGDVDNDFPV